jgi:hypothetical protein
MMMVIIIQPSPRAFTVASNIFITSIQSVGKIPFVRQKIAACLCVTNAKACVMSLLPC